LIKGDGGVPADPPRAEALLRHAIAAGDIGPGAISLGDFYRADTPLMDPAKAVDAYQLAADAGNTDAMQRLAQILTKGEGGVPADPPRAEALFKQAIAAGAIKWGGYLLGDFYLADTSLRDPPKAVDAYQQAVDAGNTDAIFNLAGLLSNANEGTLDLQRASSLLESALEGLRSNDAAFVLGNLYARADYARRNIAKASIYFGQAAAAGNTAAHLELVKIDSSNAKDTKALALAVDHARQAEKTLGAGPVLDVLLRLPAVSVIAIAQQLLSDAGESVNVTGVIGKQTEGAITVFCAKHAVTGCNPKFISRTFLQAAIFGANPN
jgi:TPR repeat protein